MLAPPLETQVIYDHYDHFSPSGNPTDTMETLCLVASFSGNKILFVDTEPFSNQWRFKDRQSTSHFTYPTCPSAHWMPQAANLASAFAEVLKGGDSKAGPRHEASNTVFQVETHESLMPRNPLKFTEGDCVQYSPVAQLAQHSSDSSVCGSRSWHEVFLFLCLFVCLVIVIV